MAWKDIDGNLQMKETECSYKIGDVINISEKKYKCVQISIADERRTYDFKLEQRSEEN